jgi:hypothetical protein
MSLARHLIWRKRTSPTKSVKKKNLDNPFISSAFIKRNKTCVQYINVIDRKRIICYANRVDLSKDLYPCWKCQPFSSFARPSIRQSLPLMQ